MLYDHVSRNSLNANQSVISSIDNESMKPMHLSPDHIKVTINQKNNLGDYLNVKAVMQSIDT